MYKLVFKRLLDILLSGIALIVLSPVLLVTALFIRIKIGSPVIFSQERPGRGSKIFKLYKFRTMLDPQTRDGTKITDNQRLKYLEDGIDVLSDEERLTRFGRFLRATSLDELPELWNIFIGNMSIVGPRPLAKIYLPYYTKEELHRHDVKPGLTGLAQVHGRNTTSWKFRFKFDLEYIENISFLNDVKIIFKTIAVVLSQKDISQGAARPEAFNVVRQRELEQSNKNNKKENFL